MNDLFIDKLLEIMSSTQPDIIKVADVYRLTAEIEEYRGLSALDLSDANDCGDACKL